ncbi:MAG: RNA-binding cell elongation regulator Jag/EloR [Chloroflexota bacterium]|nr:RNA-binding cell elongation regulator Jag/EloR [Chloroflexota bacterium]|tara:strand:+ start:836 stop:1552 length:717 start_codon:yes stop_codon:yes gene_type:complete
MSTQQFQGKTVEEATKLALEELKANLEEVNIEIISPGKSGILGLGGEPALIEVTIEDDGKSTKPKTTKKSSKKKADVPRREMDIVDEDTAKLAVDLVNYILSSLEVDVKTFFRDQDDFDNKSVYFEIEGDDSGLIIGRKGETLRSLEFLISFIIKRQLDKKVRVILDVEGYQERRRQNIASLAESAAEKVIKSGKPVKMDPMSPFDRRIVHLSLEKQSKITTESEGSGSRRQVVIKLK